MPTAFKTLNPQKLSQVSLNACPLITLIDWRTVPTVAEWDATAVRIWERERARELAERLAQRRAKRARIARMGGGAGATGRAES